MSYLNETGLAYFWGKIKAWANSVFALIGHKHPSSDVNAMTGYSMPASTGAISSGDTLNQAVGKLEKAVTDADISNVVHRTGDEIVQGVKTFSNLHAYDSNGRVVLTSIELQHPDLERGVAPISYSRFAGFIIYDKNATSYLDVSNRLAALEFGKNTDSNSYVYIKAYNPNTTDSEVAKLVTGWDSQGRAYGTAPSTDSTRTNGYDILTRDWIPKDARIVHTTGNESIAGAKIFNNGITLNTTANDFESELKFKNSNLTKGTAPSSNFEDGVLRGVDKDDKYLYGLLHRWYADGSASIRLLCYKPDVTSTTGTSTNLACGYDSDGIAYGVAPSTSTSRSNGTDIVTRDFIPNDTRIVHTTGNEDVDGIKRFLDSVKIKDSGLYSIILENTQVTIPNILPSSGTTLYRGYVVNDSAGRHLVECYHRISSTGHAKVWQMHNLSATDAASQFTFTYSKTDDIFYLSGPASFSASDDSTKIPNTAWIRDATGNFACNAATATKLATARNLKVALGSTTAVTFDGSANQNSIPVSGTLAVANGGTGLTSLDTFVRTTGAQTVGGTKTFTSDPAVKNSGPEFHFVDSNASQSDTSVGSSTYIISYDGSSTPKEFGRYAIVSATNGTVSIYFRSLKRVSSGKDAAVSMINQTNGVQYFLPDGDSAGLMYLGGGSNRWKTVYGVNAYNASSDRREKTDISPFSGGLLDAWEGIDWVQFHRIEAVEREGAAHARFHAGLIAQDVESALAASGIDASGYGFFCHDFWDAEEAYDGSRGGEPHPAREAGDAYSLRYEEALCIEAAYMRRENARLKKRVADLEERLAALELRLGSE